MKRVHRSMKPLVAILCALCALCGDLVAADQPLNVLFIYVEDLGYYTSERFAREPGTCLAGLKTPNQERTTLPEERAINVGTGSGEYGDPGQQYAIDLHDETVRQKDQQPLPYELLRQFCMGDSPKEELYDLDADPWAVKNLATDPAHATTLEKMRAEMKHWREFTGDRDIHPSEIKRRAAKTTR